MFIQNVERTFPERFLLAGGNLLLINLLYVLHWTYKKTSSNLSFSWKRLFDYKFSELKQNVLLKGLSTWEPRVSKSWFISRPTASDDLVNRDFLGLICLLASHTFAHQQWVGLSLVTWTFRQWLVSCVSCDSTQVQNVPRPPVPALTCKHSRWQVTREHSDVLFLLQWLWGLVWVASLAFISLISCVTHLHDGGVISLFLSLHLRRKVA